MYCLDKLQRELAYFFDMDLRELPRVQDLLAAKGYTQVQKGDDIIEIDSALGRYSTDLGDSSVETKELHTKTTSKLTKDELDNLPIATAQEYGEFLEKIAQKDYQNTPEILKIATLNSDLQELINNNHSASVFITRARAGHISEVRKGEYDQALTLDEQKQIPAEIAQAKQAYTDDKSGFILPFADKNNSEKINLIILDSDSKGNFLITAKKVNSAELNNPKYKKLARAGVEPATTTPPKAEQKPTEAISLARDEIIPQPSSDALPTPAQNLIKKLLHQIRRLEKSPSFREHDKIIAELKKSNDTQMLANLLKSFDERYPSAKDHYLLSGLRDSIQNTLNKLSNPHIAKVLHTFTEKSPNPHAQAQAIKELYHRYGEESLKDLFDKVLSAAGDVKFSIRQTYANANGKYSADKHLITLNRRWALDIEPQRLAQTLLHELIHATIARAQYHHFSPQAFPELAHKLTPAQKAAVQEIDDLYILAFKTHQAQKHAKTLGDDEQKFYGFTNSKEFVAELANPKFRSYLEKQNIFKRVLEAIVKFFTGGGGGADKHTQSPAREL